MTKEIIALNSLYIRTEKEFSEIKADNNPCNHEQLDSSLRSIKEFFDGLLNVIPKDITIYFGDRLQIRLDMLIQKLQFLETMEDWRV